MADSTAPSKVTGAPVHLSLLQGDGQVFGVGLPLVVYTDRAVRDKTAFERAAQVQVNGEPASGAWYWQRSSKDGQAMEAHYRLRSYWPARARIQLALPVKDLSAGEGLRFENSLTLSASTASANVTVVDCATKKLTVTSDGKRIKTLPTSCGKAKTPTYFGTKIVMQKGESKPGSEQLRPRGAVRMRSTDPADPYDLVVPWSVRLTISGEYAHAASWNGGNIGRRSTSNGCTNLTEADARWFYEFSRIGDVLEYRNTGGQRAPSWDGFGDWNISWAQWTQGGVL